MTNHKKENAYTGCSPLVRVFTPNPISKKPSVSHIIASNGEASKLSLITKGGLSPREKRALTRLLQGPVSRREFQHIVGCANGPGIIHALRGMGYSIHTERVPCHDRDRLRTNYGLYSLDISSRQKAIDTLKACS